MTGLILLAFTLVAFCCLSVCQCSIKDNGHRETALKVILLLTSHLFAAYVDWRFSLILAALSIVTYYSTKKKLYRIGIVIALLALVFFKYTNFFISSFVKLIGHDAIFLKIILPLGISFYVFSAISYLVDVEREKQEARNLLDVAVFLSFFPKLTSGPIQKSTDFFRQLDYDRNIGWNSFSIGIQIFVFGLFKKIVLADRLSIFVDQVYATPKAFGSVTVLLAAIAYSIQIYFDFSGYSDMATGCGKILGFDLPRNFNLPYLSHNVTELWKRWHISLSTWLQEYLYISLGGNRKGKIRTYVNLILTMLLGGIWHGANWTYVVWGLMHGISLAVHKGWMAMTSSPEKKHGWLANAFSVIITFIFTTLCWIFFRADSISHAFEIIKRIFSFERGLEQPYLWLFVATILLVTSYIIASFKTQRILKVKPKKLNVCSIEGFYPVFCLSSFWGQIAFFTLCGVTAGLAYLSGNPFIYGRY